MLVRQDSENEPGGDPVRKSKCDNEQSVMSREQTRERKARAGRRPREKKRGE